MIWKRERESDTETELVHIAGKRVRKLTTNAILDTAEATVMGIQRDIDDFRAEGDLASLADIGLGLISLKALTLELKARREAEVGVDR